MCYHPVQISFHVKETNSNKTFSGKSRLKTPDCPHLHLEKCGPNGLQGDTYVFVFDPARITKVASGCNSNF